MVEGTLLILNFLNVRNSNAYSTAPSMLWIGKPCFMSPTCVAVLMVWRGYYRDETPCIHVLSKGLVPFGVLYFFSLISPPQWPKNAVFLIGFLIFWFSVSHNSPPNWDGKLKIWYLVGLTLDVPFDGVNFLARLNFPILITD